MPKYEAIAQARRQAEGEVGALRKAMRRRDVRTTPSLDEVLDHALALVWMDGVNPVDVRERLKAALEPFLK